MAEDCIIGFKFYDRDDNKIDDATVKTQADALFNEGNFDAADHLGSRDGADTGLMDTADTGGMDFADAFGFVDSFDFGM